MSNKYELNDEDLQNVTGGTGGSNGFQMGQIVKIFKRGADNQWIHKCNGRVTSPITPVKVLGNDGITYQGSDTTIKFEA